MRPITAFFCRRKADLHGPGSRDRTVSRFHQLKFSSRGILIPFFLLAMPLSGCIPWSISGPESEVPDPCIQTHDQGCVAEAEYQDLAETIAESVSSSTSFDIQWALGAIRADQAYADLQLKYGPDVAPGEGTLVGVLDTGIDTEHPQFRNKEIIHRFLSGATDEDGLDISRGTAVASVIAGVDIPAYPYDAHGVAWGAELVDFRLPSALPFGPEEPATVDDLTTVDLFARAFMAPPLAWRHEGRRIDFLNMSAAYQGLIQDFGEEDLREHMSRSLNLLAQDGSDDKVVLVLAAGNNNRCGVGPDLPECVEGQVPANSPDLLAGLPARIPELREHMVAVVATQEDGELAFFSNRCGIAADNCIAAPGLVIQAADYTPGTDGGPPSRGIERWNGTSLAAPIVTGGLALVKHYFREQLSNADVLARVLETADRSGQYADAEMYGRGFMDLGAATSPVGTATVALGDQVNGSGAALGATGLQLGQAFGDGLSQSLAGNEIVAFDALGAPFWYDSSRLTSLPEAASVAERLRAFQHAPVLAQQQSASDAIRIPLLPPPARAALPAARLGLAISGLAANDAASHLSFPGSSLFTAMPVSTGLTATAVTTEGVEGQDPATGAALAWRAPGALLGVRAGWMGERRALLGTRPDGAFGSLASNTAFAGIDADRNLGPWQLSATVEAGIASVRPRDGMFRNVSSIATTGFALRAMRPAGEGSVFRVSLIQPLRVEGGEALLSLPSDRTQAGEVVRSAVSTGLEPSGRQIDLAFDWQQRLEVGVLRLGATVSRHPGHRANARPELVLLSDLRFTF